MNSEPSLSESSYNVLNIIRGTTVDGPGFRTSIYLAGCMHQCEGCHNPQSWNPDAGSLMSLPEIIKIVKEEDFNVTLTGGDPLFNPQKTTLLAKAIFEEGYKVWLYTGYKWEEIITNNKFKNLLDYVEVIVEGPFNMSLRNTDLLFRGSENQRLVKVSESLKAGEPVLWTL